MKKIMVLVFLISGAGLSRLKAQTVSFNFSAAAHTVSGWVNVAGDPSLAVRTVTDVSTGIGISSVATANWIQYSGTSASDGYGAASTTFFPTAVMANHWFQYSATLANYNAAIPQLIISGLNKDSVYTIKMSSSNITGVNTNPSRYTVTGTVVVGFKDVNTRNNSDSGATFINVAPDASGQVKIYVNTVAGSGDEAADISGLQIIRGRTIAPTPLVSITSPDNNDILPEGVNVTINATASEVGGTIQKVEFYADTTKLGEDLTAPYSFTWVNPDEGHYVIKARAIDATGNTNTAYINISIESLSGFWSTTGNIAMNPDSNFLGNVDSLRLAFRTKNIERMSISPMGNVGIGTISPTAQLHTTGAVRFAGLPLDNGQLRVLTSDTNGNLSYRISTSLGLTAGDGLGQTAGGSLALGDSIAGAGPHSFTTNRYQYLNTHLYSIGGTVNDPVAKPIFRVYDNGDLTVGTTMDKAVNTTYQSGMRYYSKLGLLQLGGSDKIDTTLNKIVYGSYQGTGILLNSDEPNTIKGRIMNTVFAGDLNKIDTLARLENDFVGTEATEFAGSLTKSVIAGVGMLISGDISNSIITGSGHAVTKLATVVNISGYANNAQDSIAGSLVGGAGNLFGGLSQFVAGNYIINKTPFGAAFGNSNVNFTSQAYTGLQGIAVPATIAQYPLLAVGNGAFNNASIRSNALTVLFNGRTQINTTGYTNTLTQAAVTPKAAFEVVSTNSGVLLPKLTTVQRNAIVTADLQNGLLLYNTDSASFQFYNGTTWNNIGGSAGTSGSGWSSSGNTGTTPGTNFIGTTDSQRLVFKTNGTERMTILPNGNIGMGTSVLPAADAKLAVNGVIYSKKIKVTQSGWPDYVFKKEYQLPSLAKVEQYIAHEGHLPGVLSATEVKNKGLDLGDNQAVLLQKIEELTLYLIEQNKKLEKQQQEIDALKKLVRP